MLAESSGLFCGIRIGIMGWYRANYAIQLLRAILNFGNRNFRLVG